jgi:hypothetical protein
MSPAQEPSQEPQAQPLSKLGFACLQRNKALVQASNFEAMFYHASVRIEEQDAQIAKLTARVKALEAAAADEKTLAETLVP